MKNFTFDSSKNFDMIRLTRTFPNQIHGIILEKSSSDIQLFGYKEGDAAMMIKRGSRENNGILRYLSVTADQFNLVLTFCGRDSVSGCLIIRIEPEDDSQFAIEEFNALSEYRELQKFQHVDIDVDIEADAEIDTDVNFDIAESDGDSSISNSEQRDKKTSRILDFLRYAVKQENLHSLARLSMKTGRQWPYYASCAVKEAVAQGKTKSLETLFGLGAKIDGYSGEETLHRAVQELLKRRTNNFSILSLILDQRVNVDTKDDHGLTVLAYAIQQSCLPMVRYLLLKGGANPSGMIGKKTMLGYILERKMTRMLKSSRY